jgi:hypothetical protein
MPAKGRTPVKGRVDANPVTTVAKGKTPARVKAAAPPKAASQERVVTASWRFDQRTSITAAALLSGGSSRKNKPSRLTNDARKLL